MELRDSIIGIIAETLHKPRTEINDASKLIDIAKDSIELFELLIKLERVLGHRVQYEEISHIETVSDVVVYIGTLSITPEMLATLQETYS